MMINFVKSKWLGINPHFLSSSNIKTDALKAEITYEKYLPPPTPPLLIAAG